MRLQWRGRLPSHPFRATTTLLLRIPRLDRLVSSPLSSGRPVYRSVEHSCQPPPHLRPLLLLRSSPQRDCAPQISSRKLPKAGGCTCLSASFLLLADFPHGAAAGPCGRSALAMAGTQQQGTGSATPAAAPPPAPTTVPAPEGWVRPWSPGLLSPEELEQYWRDGFVVKNNVFKPEELRPVMEAIDRMVDELAQRLLAAGRITDPCAGASFHTRLAQLERHYPHASVLLHKQGKLPDAFAQLWAHPRLLSAARQLLGEDVGGHPVWNLRCKTPQQEQATVPWHQDTAYLGRECWDVLQVTAWIPLVNATRRNGCMQVVRGGHRSGKTAPHTGCAGGTWYLSMDEAAVQRELGVDLQRDAETCEVPLGGVLFLNNLVPHRSLNNLSGEIRWSLDLRWQKLDLPNGFYGLKPCIRMCQAGQPGYQIDWAAWAAIDRQVLQKTGSPPAGGGAQQEAAGQDEGEGSAGGGGEDLDDTIVGPWMDSWPLTHSNRHVEAWLAGKRAITKA
ncbi:hypothetical protein ABPG75_008093 [Micractinium tetrahymenae]